MIHVLKNKFEYEYGYLQRAGIWIEYIQIQNSNMNLNIRYDKKILSYYTRQLAGIFIIQQ